MKYLHLKIHEIPSLKNPEKRLPFLSFVYVLEVAKLYLKMFHILADVMLSRMKSF